MRSKFGVICMFLGAALVLAALSLFLLNRQADRRAGEMVEQILPQIVAQIPTAGDSDSPDETMPSYPDPYDPTMTEVEIDGYAYIGYLSIPAEGLEIPVMSQWDYDRLEIAVCRYTGSTKTDDLVICGHNYTRHFAQIRNLESGDAVLFTDMDGVVWQYTVDAVEILGPTAVADMTAGDYDLTLFTCTFGGANRITVRCTRTEA